MSAYPSYCCQRCGAEIGWIGRFLQWIRLSEHDWLRCKAADKAKEKG